MKLVSGDIIVCDGVRHEMNGKMILVGVYPNDIVVSDFPATVVISLLIRFFDLEAGDYPFEVRLSGAIKGAPRLSGSFTVRDRGTAAIPIEGIPVELTGPGSIDWEGEVGQTKIDGLRSLSIRKRPIAVG